MSDSPFTLLDVVSRAQKDESTLDAAYGNLVKEHFQNSTGDRSVCCKVQNSVGGNVQYGKTSAAACKSIGGTVVADSYCD